jgi:hypothetical protein
MVYTEYFVRGTQPTTICMMHGAPSFTERLAGIFGKDAGTPVSVDHPGLPPPPASTSGTPANPTAAPAPADPKKDEKVDAPKKKRGFWSRVFGVGGGDDERKEEKKKEEERKKEDERRKLEERRRRGG